MRILETEDIAILDRIADTQSTEILSCSDLLVDLFPKDKSAIIVDDRTYLLVAQGFEIEAFYARILKVISLITEARDEGLVYMIPSYTQSPCLIQQQISREIFIDNGVSKCDIGVITHLSVESIKVEGELIYQGFALPKAINSIITSGIYCTKKLRKLKQDKYQTEEQQRYKTELKFTRIGLAVSLVALFFSLVSPLWMTEYNNRFAYTTIENVQYSNILHKLDSINNYLDSIRRQSCSTLVIDSLKVENARFENTSIIIKKSKK